jgi:16S rRNA (uracil1498-N3)-methyltransferase
LLDFEKINQATIIIGPEGGLSKAEINLAVKHNAQALLLGSRVLRTETASLVALANMQLLWGS